jgi:hypothetical protein
MKIERRDQEKDRKNSRDEFENANRSQILLLLIHTRCDIVLRRRMREILYVLQKEKFSKRRKILLL